MFWQKKKAQVEELADDAVKVAADIAEKSMVIGPTGVVLLLGAAAAAGVAAYIVARNRKSHKG